MMGKVRHTGRADGETARGGGPGNIEVEGTDRIFG
jgi:hypothetical protein